MGLDKMRMFGVIGLVILGLFMAYGCTQPSEQPTVLNETGVTQEQIDKVVDANNKFAIEMYKQLSGNSSEDNVFFSPYSISSAMAIVYEGARGTTADEIRTVFSYPEDIMDLRKGYAHLFNSINKPNENYELRTANALWAQKDYPFLDEYLETAKTYYGGKLANLDFVNDPEGSRTTINRWVENQTNGKIKDLLPKGSVNPLTRLVVTNAVYFKGKWVKQFDPKDTYKTDFHVTPEKKVKVDMMALRSEVFNYTEDDTVKVLELPYSGNRLSMLVILPKQNHTIDEVEDSLTIEKIREWQSNLNPREIDVHLPKFKMETKYKLNDVLSTMGMPTAFIPDTADFSGMNGNRELFISHVIHQAYVDVNEEGTEAAAATGITMELSAVPPENPFVADHPFIFLIVDKETGGILFMGRLSDPSKTGA